eukprot:157841-Prymnesium_polylepis.2
MCVLLAPRAKEAVVPSCRLAEERTLRIVRLRPTSRSPETSANLSLTFRLQHAPSWNVVCVSFTSTVSVARPSHCILVAVDGGGGDGGWTFVARRAARLSLLNWLGRSRLGRFASRSALNSRTSARLYSSARVLAQLASLLLNHVRCLLPDDAVHSCHIPHVGNQALEYVCVQPRLVLRLRPGQVVVVHRVAWIQAEDGVNLDGLLAIHFGHRAVVFFGKQEDAKSRVWLPPSELCPQGFLVALSDDHLSILWVAHCLTRDESCRSTPVGDKAGAKGRDSSRKHGRVDNVITHPGVKNALGPAALRAGGVHRHHEVGNPQRVLQQIADQRRRQNKHVCIDVQCLSKRRQQHGQTLPQPQKITRALGNCSPEQSFLCALHVELHEEIPQVRMLRIAAEELDYRVVGDERDRIS